MPSTPNLTAVGICFLRARHFLSTPNLKADGICVLPSIHTKFKIARQDAPLDNPKEPCYHDSILKKAWKRTLSGKNFRETLSWAESSVSQNRNSHRLGAARRYVGRDGTSRYRGHERHNAQKDFRWREGRMCARNPGRVSFVFDHKILNL